MSKNLQNKVLFPAPSTSYTCDSAQDQVIYLPRNLMHQVNSSTQNHKEETKEPENSVEHIPCLYLPAE